MSEQKARPDVPRPQATLCPYCGHLSGNPNQCRVCRGRFDHLSRQATQNTMGPWYLRNTASPHLPGCSYETIRKLAARGKIDRTTIMRGPTTRQFWVIANRVPGVAHLLGECHNCHAPASPSATECDACGVSFMPDLDRQQLGLAPVHLLPGQATPEQIAAHSSTPAGGPPSEDEDLASPAESDVIDEIVEEPVRTRSRRPVGRVAAGMVLIGVCAAMGWFGYQRAMMVASAPEPPAVPEIEAHEPTPEEIASVDPPVPESAPAVSVNPEHTVIGLLRDGRVEAAREALTEQGVESGPEFEAVRKRAERDRIRSFLAG